MFAPISIVRRCRFLFDTRPASSKIDCFQLLGINRSFDVDAEQLKETYKDNMKRFHPDLHSMKSDTEKAHTSNLASQVTAAYQILSDPHERAMHLLELFQTPMDEQATGDLVGHDFLIDIMKIREDIENTSSQGKLKSMLTENEEAISKTCSLLSNAFEKHNLQDEWRYTAQLQYWKRVREILVEKIQD